MSGYERQKTWSFEFFSQPAALHPPCYMGLSLGFYSPVALFSASVTNVLLVLCGLFLLTAGKLYLEQVVFRDLGEQEWRSGDSARLPPMWPGFKS